MTTIAFFVFSYNKGRLLANCVESIEQCAPFASITVVDDRSDDPETCRILEQLAASHRVIQSLARSRHKHGGLYHNMQLALDTADQHGLACFVQDDTQIVRPLTQDDETSLAACFANDSRLGFIRPTFLKGSALARGRGTGFRFDAGSGLYFAQPDGRSAGVHYSDVFLAPPERLRAVGWRFQFGEGANQALAARHFGPMGYLQYPFVMWLPHTPAFRGRQKTWTLSIAERVRGCGIYPYRIMRPDEVRALGNAAQQRPAVAEDFLTPAQGTPSKPWIYHPLQGSRWLKHLHSLELAVRGLGR